MIFQIEDEDVAASAGIQAPKLSYVHPTVGAVPRTIAARLADSASIKDFGAVCDGIADDTAALQAAINSGMGRIVVLGTVKISSTITLASNCVLWICPGASVVWSGGAGNVFEGPSSALLMHSGIICNGGTINITGATTGLRLHSTQYCYFDLEFIGSSQSNVVVQHVADGGSGKAYNSGNNVFDRIIHQGDCGTLLCVAGSSANASYNTISTYGHIRLNGNAWVAGIQFGENCDTNYFGKQVSLDLVNGATGIKYGDFTTCYGHHFSDVNVAFYGTPSNRVAVYVGNGVRWAQIDNLFIDSSNAAEVNAGAVIANAGALSYRISVVSEIGTYCNQGSVFQKGYTTRARNFVSQQGITLGPGQAIQIADVPASGCMIVFAANDGNFMGVAFAVNGTQWAPTPLLGPQTYVAFGNGPLSAGGGVTNKLNINTCTDGTLYLSMNVPNKTINLSLTFIAGVGP